MEGGRNFNHGIPRILPVGTEKPQKMGLFPVGQVLLRLVERPLTTHFNRKGTAVRTYRGEKGGLLYGLDICKSCSLASRISNAIPPEGSRLVMMIEVERTRHRSILT
jgi:hypothetical protein